MEEYPWYQVVTSEQELKQGDLITSCPFIFIKKDVTLEQLKSHSETIAEIREYDVIIISQSCDLANKKVDYVIVSPVWTFEEFAETNEFFKSEYIFTRKNKAGLRKFFEEESKENLRKIDNLFGDIKDEIFYDRDKLIKKLDEYNFSEANKAIILDITLDEKCLEKNNLRKGEYIGYHLLNECREVGFKQGFLVVDFRNTYSVPLKFLNEYVKSIDKRVRLMPPYRESLAQAFGVFIMRIGIDKSREIPPFQKKSSSEILKEVCKDKK